MHGRLGVTLLVAMPLLAACGLASDHVSTAGPDEVPHGLLEPALVDTSTTFSARTAQPGVVWLVGDDRILPVDREMAAPLTVDGAVDALLAGPTNDEAARGLRSALPDDIVLEVSATAGVATIDLAPDLSAAAPKEQVLGIAQLVYTVTELGDVQVVRFVLDGEPIEVPRADGSVSDGPVTRSDYRELTVPA